MILRRMWSFSFFWLNYIFGPHPLRFIFTLVFKFSIKEKESLSSYEGLKIVMK
jgi:hypothetical protein